MKPSSSFLMLLFISMAMIASAESRSLFGGRIAAAALFGKNSQDEKESKESAGNEPPIPPVSNVLKPPPPPPGRPPLPTAMMSKSEKQAKIVPPPPPPKPDGDQKPKEEIHGESLPQSSTASSETTTTPTFTANPQEPTPEQSQNEPWSQQQQQQQQSWGGGSWGNDGQSVQQQLEQQYPYYAGDGQYNSQQNQWPTIEQQLDDSLNREHSLVDQVQNLTGTITSMQQQDLLHTRQMDVLTERIMEAEAQIARERNNALEYQNNCTEMGRQIAVLHEELLDWQSRCAGFADQHKHSEGKLKELKKDLKEARAEAENLAISIENSRIRDHMDDSRRKKKKSRGLLGCLFSFLVSSEPELDADMESPQVSDKVSYFFVVTVRFPVPLRLQL